MSYKPPEELPAVNIPVSVIISARNEAINLSNYLPSILIQEYPDFEVIVVNDRSYDGTDVILEEFQKKHKHLKVVTVADNDKFITGKKFALTMGIKAAKNEHLLFTDADCQPASVNWINRMAANFESPVQLVLGYSPYKKTRNLLNAYIRYETVKTALNYLSAAIGGNAYMGVGRNLAYTKSLFFSVKGFASHMHVMSGDDDLFVNQNAKRGNNVIEIHPETFTYSDAKTSLPELFRQKKRHMSAGKLYQSRHKRMLALDAVSGFVFYLLLIILLVFTIEPLLALGLLIFRWIIQLIIYRKVFKKLAGSDLLIGLPLFDLLYYTYLNVFGLLGPFMKSTKWK